MLSYLAAGLKGIGIWCWNPRDKGWEIGEYSLTDLTGRPTSRSRAAGAIARACEKYRFELWEAYDQPQVGILYSWENDAAFARLSYGGYPLPRLEEYSHYPAWARIGAMRTLINHCVPFELVTERNLKDGLAGRYRTIYVPHTICLEEAVVELLQEYVTAGGRLVVDSPSLLIRADDGTLFNTRQGSTFEQMMGLEIANIQSTFNYPLSFRSQQLQGFFTDLHITTATVLETFQDGRPAVLAHRCGRGTTAFVAFEAASMCHKPSATIIEDFLTDLLLDGQPSAYSVDCPILAYRRVAPTADHFFLLNDTSHRQAFNLTVHVQTYTSGVDCITGEPVTITGGTLSLTLEPWQGRWVRLTHSGSS
jgi:beta-galactosidase